MNRPLRQIRTRRSGLRFKLLLFVLVSVSVSVVGLVVQNRPASADQCFDNNTMLNCRIGFFKGLYDPLGEPVFPNGIPNDIDTAAEFVNMIRANLHCTSEREGGYILTGYDDQMTTGSAFIVMSMLGWRPQPGLTKHYACGEFTRWQELIYDYDKAGQINWHNNTRWEGNTYFQDDHGDAAYVSPGSAFSGTDPLITFHKKGRWAYSIRRACANPVGRLTPLVPLEENPSAAPGSIQANCNSAVTGRVRDPDTYQPLNVRAIFSDNRGWSQQSNVVRSDPQNSGDPNQTYAFPGIPPPDRLANGLYPWQVIVQVQDVPNDNWVTVGGANGNACIVPVAECSSSGSTNPQEIDPRTRFNAQGPVSFRNNNPQTNRSAQQTALSLQRYGGLGQPYIRVVNQAGTVLVNLQPPTRVEGPVNGTMTLFGDNMGPVEAGQHGVFWGYTGGLAPANCPRTFDPSLPGGGGQVVKVANRPYFSVKNGDISAGGAIASSGTDNPGGSGNGSTPDVMGECTSPLATPENDKAGLVSWNKGTTAFSGAGTNYAALAMGSIQDVVSAQNSGDVPDGLTFANARMNGARTQGLWPGGNSENFGGGFGGTCTPNYYDDTKAVDGPYRANDQHGAPNRALVISKNGAGGTIAEEDTIYVDGDAYITNNITFERNGGYADVSDIPRFTIVARGNIYISPDVTEIHGVLVAQPEDGVTDSGRIYTCAPAGIQADPVSVLDRGLYDSCNKGLAIYGAVSAKQIWFLRTYGTVTPPTSGPPTPSEHFYFTPEVWLGRPFTSDLSGKMNNYNAVSSLPPIL